MTEALENILGGAAEPASATEQTTEASTDVVQPADTGTGDAAASAAATPPGKDDDDEPEAIDHGGKKLVAKEALDAARGKVRRYTDEVASMREQLAEQAKAFQDANRAWETRLGQIIGVLQQQHRPEPQRQPEQSPDFFADPDAYLGHAFERVLTPIIRNQQVQAERMSRRFAEQAYGRETVETAYDALEAQLASDPAARADLQKIMSGADPWGELVNWHRKAQAIAEIGTDPAAYRERLMSELLPQIKAQVLAELQGQGGAQSPAGQTAPARSPVMPTNLAGTRSAAPRSGSVWGGPTPITDDIFDRRKRAG